MMYRAHRLSYGTVARKQTSYGISTGNFLVHNLDEHPAVVSLPLLPTTSPLSSIRTCTCTRGLVAAGAPIQYR